MSYNQNIPQASQFLSASQSDLLGNFQALDTTFQVDHTAFSNTTPQLGQHSQVTLFQGRANPSLTFPASMIYSVTTGTTPNRVTNLFYGTKPESGTAQYLAMTNLTINTFANSGTGGGNGYYILTPWGINFMWGQTASSQAFPSVVFPFTFSTNTYSVQLTVIGLSTTVQEVSKSTTGFTSKVGSAATLEWLVIGS